MHLSKTKEIYQLALSAKISGSELIEQFKAIEPRQEVIDYIIVELKDATQTKNSVKLTICLKAIYTYQLEDFVHPIIEFLEFYSDENSEDLFEVIAEIEFSFTLLGMLKNKDAINVLKHYSTKEFSWDDMGNISKAALYGIENINKKV